VNTTPKVVVLCFGMPESLAGWKLGQTVFVCADMLTDLRMVEQRRWKMWGLRRRLEELGARTQMLGEFLEPGDVEWLESRSEAIATSWFEDAEGDWTCYRGVSIGEACRYRMKARSMRMLKCARALTRLVSCYADAEYWSDAEEGWPETEIMRGLGMHWQGVRRTAEHVWTQRSSEGGSVLGTIELSFRKAAFRCLQLWGDLMNGGAAERGPTAIVRVTLQTLGAIGVWARRPSKEIQIGLWGEYLTRPLETLRLVARGAVIVGGEIDCEPEDRAGWAMIREKEVRKIEELNAQYESDRDAEVRAGSLGKIVEEEFGGKVRSLCAEVDRAYVVLGRDAVRVVVVPNDCQAVMRVWVRVSHRLRRASLVVQHGHLEFKGDENHWLGEFSAFWTAETAAEYIRLGLDRRRVFLTGSPNIDRYATRQRGKGEPRGKGRLRVVIFTAANPGVQPYLGELCDQEYAESVLKELWPARDTLDVTVKLHPGEHASEYQGNLGAWIGAGVRVVERCDVGRLLKKSDIVISTLSTVVLEALALGKPVLLVPPATIDSRKSQLESLQGVWCLRPGERIREGLKRVLAESRTGPSSGERVEVIVGPQDGRSGERLLDVVVEITRLQRGRFRDEMRRREAALAGVGGGSPARERGGSSHTVIDLALVRRWIARMEFPGRNLGGGKCEADRRPRF